MTTTIDKDRVSELLADPHLKLIDARPTAAYNGWRLRDETRGGHISGAVSFPAAWATSAVNRDLKARLVAKKITPGQRIVVYGDDASDSGALVERLSGLGYQNVAIYPAGFADWADDQRLTVEQLRRYAQLVHPRWLRELLLGQAVEAAPPGDFAVVHVNHGFRDEYRQGHIPGALYLDTNTLESPTDWNRRSPQELQRALLDLGITNATTVIVYGKDRQADPTEPMGVRAAGQLAARRAAAILLYAGVPDVRVLDGGYEAWLAEVNEVETAEPKPQAVESFGLDIPARPDFLIDLEQARDLLVDPHGVLVSIRGWAEHIGETSGYDYIDEIGDIPGAVWANQGTGPYDMHYYRNVDNTMRDFNEIASNWKEVGVTSEKKVAFYCGTGWRASEAFLCAYLMGWPHIAVYDGGWFEWSQQEPAHQ